MPGGAPAGKRHAPNGAGSIYKETVKAKRANGEVHEYVRWVGSMTLANGKRKRVVAPTQREATARLNELRTEQAKGIAPTVDRQTVAEYLTWWLENSLRCKPTSLRAYESVVRSHLIPHLGRIPAAKLTPEQVEHMMAQLVRAGQTHARANAIRAVLCQALNVLLKRRRIMLNAAALVDPYRQEHNEPEIMAPEECQRWLTALADHRDGAMYLLAMTTGLRQGELLGLRWQDVDLEHATLTVRQNMQLIPDARGKLAQTPTSLKSESARRKVPLPSFAVDRLHAHLERQDDWRALAGDAWQDNDLVFPGRRGQAQWASVVLATFHRATAAAGLPTIKFHHLRHVYQSLLVHLGVHEYVAQELMGHSEERVNRRYTHIYDSAKVAAADALDALLRAP